MSLIYVENLAKVLALNQGKVSLVPPRILNSVSYLGTQSDFGTRRNLGQVGRACRAMRHAFTRDLAIKSQVPAVYQRKRVSMFSASERPLIAHKGQRKPIRIVASH